MWEKYKKNEGKDIKKGEQMFTSPPGKVRQIPHTVNTICISKHRGLGQTILPFYMSSVKKQLIF